MGHLVDSPIQIICVIFTYLFASLGFGTGFELTSTSFISSMCPFTGAVSSSLTSADDSVLSAALCDCTLFSNSLWMAFGGGSGEGSFLFGGGFA